VVGAMAVVAADGPARRGPRQRDDVGMRQRRDRCASFRIDEKMMRELELAGDHDPARQPRPAGLTTSSRRSTAGLGSQELSTSPPRIAELEVLYSFATAGRPAPPRCVARATSTRSTPATRSDRQAAAGRGRRGDRRRARAGAVRHRPHHGAAGRRRCRPRTVVMSHRDRLEPSTDSAYGRRR